MAMQKKVLSAVLLFLSMVLLSSVAAGETVKTKVITLVDRDVTCTDSPVQLYLGNRSGYPLLLKLVNQL